jgi:hypothetical protein
MRPPSALEDIRRLARSLVAAPGGRRSASRPPDAAEEAVALIRRRSAADRVSLSTRLQGGTAQCPSAAAHRDRLSGNRRPWSPPFNLARAIERELPEIEGRRTRVRIHNDAVVQGLGDLPFMRGVERWGIFTVGTGLGNAHFTGMRHPG